MMASENKFVFVAPAYNASKTVEKTIQSLVCQTYENWHLHIRDDLSTDDTELVVNRLIEKYDISNKISFVKNEKKCWEILNVLNMIREDSVGDDDIICRIDCDDFLTDLCALQDINAAYNQTGAEVLWTAHRWSNSFKNISAAMPSDADPYRYPWVTSHLKTFRKYLINDIKEENFLDRNGEYGEITGDQYLYLPILHQTKKRVYFPRQVYYYTINLEQEDLYSNEYAKFQAEEAQWVRNRGFVK